MYERCESCGVSVPYNSNCPLCGKFIREGERAARYPTPATGRKISAKKILRFVFLVSGFLCLFIDWFTGHFHGWSVIACIGLFLSWVVCVKPIFDRRPLGIYILYGVLLISAFLFVIDWRTGYLGWSLSYVGPGVVAGGITVLMFSALIRKVRWNEIGVYIITLAILDVILLILGLLDLHPYNGLCVIVAAYSLLCLFALKYFLNRYLKAELNRRLHL